MGQQDWIGYELGGRYRIEEEIGQGGMATVFRATDPNLKRDVAIKLVHQHLTRDPDFVKRFEAEAAAVAQLSHPNIIRVFDYNADGEVSFMVLEFLEGQTLQDILGERLHLPLEDVVRYGGQVCDAVGYAHQRGMLHRDIKPANIFITSDDRAVLMDFGIVKIAGESLHTATGAVMGTAKYLAPETIRGEPASAQSDIYALGVTLYEMVSGTHPYQASSVATMLMMHVNAPIPNIQEVSPDTPVALRHIIEKSLAKDPAERYGSASELGTALRTMTDPWPEMGAPSVLDVPATEHSPPAAVAAPPVPPSRPAPPVEQAHQSPPGAAPPRKGPKVPRLVAIGGGALLVIACLVVFGVLVLPRLLNPAASSATNGENTPVGEVTEAAGSDPTATPTPTPAPTATTEPTPIPPTPTTEPTPYPEPYVAIQSITVDGSTFVVDYETYGYTEALPGQHIHFFFDTVSPDQAGVPGGGQWYVWGGPRPFNGYTTVDRPAQAGQMCALVANADHTVQPESGNCYPLP